MHTIPDTFCPAKWDEVIFNLNYNYVYACCKATPIKFYKDINEVMKPQRDNLLAGVQDPSCNYCWTTENNGFKSSRHEYLSKFDVNTFPQYLRNEVTPSFMELNIGNECNFQCVYCNPKFSSQWDADIRKNPYAIFTDRFNYELIEKNSEIKLNTNPLAGVEHIDMLSVIGGEPLLNKNLWPLLESISANKISIVTNLSAKNYDKLFALHTRYKEIRLIVSIDATGKIAEFSRYGLNFNQFVNNLTHIFNNAPDNFIISVASLMTSVTIRDLENFTKLVEIWHDQFPTLQWYLSYCKTPEVQGFGSLPEKYRQTALDNLKYIKTLKYVYGVNSVEGALLSTKFNSTLHKQMIHFLTEFSTRKNIEIPLCLD